MSNIEAPIISYKAPHRTHNMRDVYGLSPTGRYLPNPKDWIVKDDVDVIQIVVSVDYAKYEIVLRDWGIDDVNNSSHILGAINYLSPRMYRFYVDTSKAPSTINLDGRVGFSPYADSIRIFLGTDISSTGDCISGYMRAGELVSTNIPMVSVDGKKFPLEGVLTRPIEVDYTTVTFVVYNEENTPIVVETASLVKTAFISKAESPSRELISVELVSPWLATPSSNVLRFPVNLPYDDMLFSVKLTYNDGIVVIPLDGSRAKLIGLNNAGSHDTYYIASNPGHELRLVFSYRLGLNELYTGQDLVGDTIVKDYLAVTEAVDGAYSLKLFVVPEWVGGSLGWRLRYYLYDLRRSTVFDATAHVKPAVNSTAFDPNLYGIKQKIIVTADVEEIASVYKSHQHPQSFHITLLNRGNEPGTPYLIDYVPTGESYGRDLKALYNYDNVSYSTIDITCRKTSMAEWLKDLYEPLYPLFDRAMESGPLAPTHVTVRVRSHEVTIPVTEWHLPINVPSNLEPGDVVELRWIRNEPRDSLELAVGGIMLERDQMNNFQPN